MAIYFGHYNMKLPIPKYRARLLISIDGDFKLNR